jgi:hypothetical protein
MDHQRGAIFKPLGLELTRAARLDAYLRSVPELLSRSGKKLRWAMKDNALAR